MSYSELTRRYFDEAPGAGILEGPHTARGCAGRIAEGTWVQFDLELEQARERIARARFLAFGCPHVIAVAAWVVEQAAGRALEPRLPESVEALRARFEVPVEKLGRLLLIEDAFLAAVSAARATVARPIESCGPTPI